MVFCIKKGYQVFQLYIIIPVKLLMVATSSQPFSLVVLAMNRRSFQISGVTT